MPHDTSLITMLVGGFVLAFVLGALARRAHLSPLVGYLVAGIIAGPYTPGFVGDQELAPQLAEIGVILLMFGVGLHFSWRDLMSVRHIALPGALAQIAVATTLGWGMARWLGWSNGAGLVFGLSLSCASTVVLLRALEPLAGLERMRQARPKARSERDLCSGPAKLAQALGITGIHDGVDLASGVVRILDDGVPPPGDPVVRPRIGITRAADVPWRWYVRGNPHVSRP